MNKSSSKKPYRAQHVNKVSVQTILDRSEGKRLVVAIDVAKEKMVAAIMTEDEQVLVTVKWSHPTQSEAFYELVEGLQNKRQVEVAMEPTGTFGDALRSQLFKRKIKLFSVNPKLVHDAREIYDGVPSSHDAKASAIIGMLHLGGRSRQFKPMSISRKRMKAALSTLYRYEEQFYREQRQLFALLVRFWPGLTDILGLGTKSLLTLVAEMGSAEAVRADPDAARQVLRDASKNSLSSVRIDAILNNAASAYGEAAIPEEVEALKSLAADTLRTREKVSVARKALEALAVDEEATKALIPLLGKATAGALFAELGDLRHYDSPGSLVRAFGLNLKEVSSGKLKGQLRITKRGSSRARHYLFYAALRLIYRNSIVRAWYAKKKARSTDSGLIGVIAVMRKVALALWHVARGAAFDASKLYDTTRLNLKDVAMDASIPTEGVDQEQLSAA